MRSYDIVKKVQDLTHLSWNERVVTSGTRGVFPKSRETTSRGNVYYKLSNYDRYRGIFGHESVNELVASRLLDLLGISHVPYKLIHAVVEIDNVQHETWLSQSRDYRKPHQRKQALDRFYELREMSRENSPLDFCKGRGWSDGIFKMMAFDYLIINRDRHGANVEVLITDDDYALAPFYDHGLSFVYSCYDDESAVERFDSLGDVPAHNYIGSKSLEANLELLPKGLFKKTQFCETDCELVLKDLDGILPSAHLGKIKEILLLRWMHLIDLGIVS